MALQVKRALESVGYEVIMIEPGSSAPPSMSTLKVTITEFYFKNYNWLWPVVPTWGQIELSLALHKPDGTIGLKKSLRGNGTSYCLTGDCAFGSATKEAMTEVLNRIVAVCLTDEFRQALTSQ